MKKIAIIIISCFISVFAIAQFGGGTGTAQDPYRIYTGEDLIEFCNSMNQGHSFTDTVFYLMNDIEEPTIIPTIVPTTAKANTFFNGYFNGRGHFINIENFEYGCFFATIDSLGILDSLEITGEPRHFFSIVYWNYGIIRNCINDINDRNFSIDGGGVWFNGFAYINVGLIENCINFVNITSEYVDIFSGICGRNGNGNTNAVVRNCINNGNASNKNMYEAVGIASVNSGIIEYCINNGNFHLGTYLSTSTAGIAYYSDNKVMNCINTGDIIARSEVATGGIVGSTCGIIENCLNTGKIQNHYTIEANNYSNPGLGIADIAGEVKIQNCLNIANTSHGTITDTIDYLALQIDSLINNYYDKQLCLSKGIGTTDIPNKAEGKLTYQLVGTSPELQAMLGDGWSYAEGRYPIPLGLENDSIALVAATPIYLHYEDDDNYNHIDSVSSNFTVGLENNVTWSEINNKVLFDNENASIMDFGYDTLIVNLGEYQKRIFINIRIPDASTTFTVSGVVTDSNNNPLEGVIISVSNNPQTTTAVDGSYSFTTNANTSLLISASKEGYTFSPSDTTINVVVSDIENINFVGTLEGGQVAIDETILNTFTVFPNPSNGIVNLVSKQNGEINIFDIAGKLVYRTTASADETISFELQQGVYFVKQNTKVEKLIVE